MAMPDAPVSDKQIPRYKDRGDGSGMEPAHEGSWVRFDDYMAIRAELAEARAEVERLTTELRIIASLPVPASIEARSLGWLKARANAALTARKEADNAE